MLVVNSSMTFGAVLCNNMYKRSQSSSSHDIVCSNNIASGARVFVRSITQRKRVEFWFQFSGSTQYSSYFNPLCEIIESVTIWEVTKSHASRITIIIVYSSLLWVRSPYPA